jgi:hypothetical protein
MNYLNTLRGGLRSISTAPRPAILWEIIFFLSFLLFLAEIALGLSVFSVVQVGMEGKRQEEVKSIDSMVKKIYDPARADDALAALKQREAVFTELFAQAQGL